MKKINLMLLAIMLVITSCKKDKTTVVEEPAPTPTPTTNGTLKINFNNKVGAANLMYNTTYTIQSGDSIKVTMFKYYISNIVLTKDDNSTYVVPNSYDLIDNASKTTINLSNVPGGKYKSMQFMIGVDSTRNVSGAQDGDLATSKGMFWTWNSGYIFFKLEGSSPQSGATNKSLVYHIGGFSGANKGLKTVNINFGGNTANVSETANPNINLTTDVLEVFKNPTTINVATTYFQMAVNTGSKAFADNYMDMISFTSITN